MLALVDDARAEGLDVTFDLYPYEWASTRLLIMLPPWVQAGGPGPLKERLADRAVARPDPRRAARPRRGCYAGAERLGRPAPRRASRGPSTSRWEGRTLGDLMRETRPRRGRRHLRPAPRRGPARQPGHAGAAHRRHPAPFLRHPVAMVGTDCTFIGAKPSPRTYGSFPRILGQFVREERLLGSRRRCAR